MTTRCFVLGAAGLALASLLTPGCARDDGGATAGAMPAGQSGKPGGDDKPVPVEFVSLETGELEAALTFSANLEAEKQVMVMSRTAGQIEKLSVEEGDQVRANEVLLRIEDDEARSQLARAEHDLANAKREHERNTQLHSRGIVSDQAKERAEYELQRSRIAVDDARRAVQYTTVRAPIAGTVTLRSVEYGDQVTPNQQLFEVTDFDSIVARIYVPESQLGVLAPGLEARIAAQAAGIEVPAGKVERVAPVVDPKSGTVKVTVDIPRHASLKPGMFVNVELVTERRTEALLLPKRALVYDNDEPYAFVIDGDRVAKRRVVIALEDEMHVMPGAGFAPGDQVVVAGQIGLKDKARVEAKPAPDPTAAAR